MLLILFEVYKICRMKDPHLRHFRKPRAWPPCIIEGWKPEMVYVKFRVTGIAFLWSEAILTCYSCHTKFHIDHFWFTPLNYDFNFLISHMAQFYIIFYLFFFFDKFFLIWGTEKFSVFFVNHFN